MKETRQPALNTGCRFFKREPGGGVMGNKSRLRVDKAAAAIYGNGNNVNKADAAPPDTGLPLTTEAITLTDTDHGSSLIAPRCMLGYKQARRRVKTRAGGDLPGKTNYH